MVQIQPGAQTTMRNINDVFDNIYNDVLSKFVTDKKYDYGPMVHLISEINEDLREEFEYVEMY